MTNNDDTNTTSENIMFDLTTLDLKNKVSVDENGVDPSQIEKAESIIAIMTDSYLDWAMEDVGWLQHAYVQLEKNINDYEPYLRQVFEISHDMKGQGGSFGYKLVTEIGNYLCRFIERIKDKPTQKILDIIKLHIDAIRMVLVGKMTGRGGDKGESIIAGLEATLQKYTPDLIIQTRQLREEE